MALSSSLRKSSRSRQRQRVTWTRTGSDRLAVSCTLPGDRPRIDPRDADTRKDSSAWGSLMMVMMMMMMMMVVMVVMVMMMMVRVGKNHDFFEKIDLIDLID